MKRLVGFVLTVLVAAAAAAQDKPASASWGALSSLIGEWSGGGTGQPGEAAGTVSFAQELNGTVLVRRNRVVYPATNERPGFTHEDLMYLFHDPQDRSLRGIYFDMESHIIEYRCSAPENGRFMVCQSDRVPSLPTYRLTYTKPDPNTLTVTFEIAPPGKTTEFKKYVEGTVKRVPPLSK